MPIYEYECQKCGEIFDVFQKVGDPAPKRHSCGSRRVRRVMSQTSFILKGSGWYVTDYARKERKQGERGGAKADGGAKTDGGAKADGGSGSSETKSGGSENRAA